MICILHQLFLGQLNQKNEMGEAPHTGMEQKRNAYCVQVGKSEEKRPLGKIQAEKGENIKMDCKEAR